MASQSETGGLVLASKSASRRAMLDAAGVAYRSIPADLDERALEAQLGPAARPQTVALELARAKALSVCLQAPEELVLGSDSLVECGGRRFDKPACRSDAVEHLRFFSGKVMHLHSAAVIARGGEVLRSQVSVASLQVAQLSDRFIEDYLDHEWPAVSGCVGVFRIEGRGVQLFRAIEGDHFTVLGMPLLAVLQFLRELGALSP
ncbi:Maf family protein [Novosphingobium sp. M1R2S20]|uniref:Nucleoside triphosphate pyrophosphatase n=1 Tax=Novosphingobium rhizovicinum TaxID=3228928 RepID=A0ABV3R9I9_9SPHN